MYAMLEADAFTVFSISGLCSAADGSVFLLFSVQVEGGWLFVGQWVAELRTAQFRL